MEVLRDNSERAASLLKSLANPDRLLLLCQLVEGERSVTELEALRRCGLAHVRLNATKSVIGHGLTAAGAVELIAVLVQMREGRLHPTRNLDHPMAPEFDWVGDRAVPHVMRNALNLSMGFGGVNTAICLRAC